MEVDPPGHSIFTRLENEDRRDDGRESWHYGDSTSGYVFVLNVGHRAYTFFQGRGDTEVVKFYEQEQMLRQAYRIAFDNNVYKGPAEGHRENLQDANLSAGQLAGIFDEIVGTALNTMRDKL